MGENIHDLGVGKEFLNGAQKLLPIKENLLINWNNLRLRTSIQGKTHRVKRQPSKHCVYPQKTHNKNILKTPANLYGRERQPNRKMSKAFDQVIHKRGHPNDQ